MTPLPFYYLPLYFSELKDFCQKSFKGTCTSLRCLGYGKFEQILWERFENILKQSFERHKNSE